MSVPAKLPRWTTDPSGLSPGAVEPDEGKKDEGYRNGEEPSAGEFNWFLQHLSNWITHRVQSRALRGFRQTGAQVDALTRFTDGCFALGAGTDQLGMFIFVGHNGADQRLIATGFAGEAGQWNIATPATDIYLGVGHGGAGDLGAQHTVIVGRNVTSGAQAWSAPDDADTTTLTVTERSGNLPGGIASDSALNSVVWNGSVWCAGGNNGTIVTAADHTFAGSVLRTPDGGYTGTIFKMIAVGSRLIFFGRSGSGAAEIQYSDNDGASWQSVYSSSAVGDLTCAVYCGGGVLLAGTKTGNTVLRSDDTGLTWDEVDTIPTTDEDGLFETELQELLWFFDGVAYAVLKKTDAQARVLVASFDKGLTWPKQLRLPTGSRSTWCAAANDGNRVCAGGGDPLLTTEGLLWTSEEIFSDV